MPLNNSRHDLPAEDRFARPVSLLWALAVLFAIVNGLFVVRRAPLIRIKTDTPAELAAQAAANWLRQESAGARMLLLRSHTDETAIWYDYRLNYLTYPRRHDTAWTALPEDAARRYDLILAIGAARAAVPPAWTPFRRSAFATLYASDPAFQPPPGAPAAPDPPLRPGGRLFAIIGLAAVVLLGALLLGWTTRVSPFPQWWANLALAHLVGATALTWIVTVAGIAAGSRLLVWPVYLALALLAPGAGRAWRCLTGRAGYPATQEPQAPAPEAPTATGRDTNAPSRRLALIAVIALGILMMAETGWLTGIGWDGYAIWQFKARAFLNDGNMSLLHDPHFAGQAEMDYPLLVPLQTWWAGAHLGGYREGWAQVIGILFALDALALFAAFARPYLSRERLLLGLALLSTLPVFTVHSVSGFADIEVACWFLALALFLARLLVNKERAILPVLMWIFAGFVLVKNEGLLGILAGLALLLGMGQKRGIAAVIRCGAAAVLAYLPWFALKRAWHLHNNVVEARGKIHLTAGLLAWRLGYSLLGFARNLAQTGPRAGGWGLLALLLPLGLVQTIRRRVRICVPLWTLCALQFAGYVGIYLITPFDLKGHLQSSVDRLVLHLAPTLLLAALLGTFGGPDLAHVNLAQRNEI